MATHDDLHSLFQMVPNIPDGTPYYEMLLRVIEDIGRDIRPTYTFNKLTCERLKRNIQTAKVLIKACQQEADSDKKKADAANEKARIQEAAAAAAEKLEKSEKAATPKKSD